MPRSPFAAALLAAAGLAAPSPAADDPRTFAETVSLYFVRWDADRDGVLSPAEINAAVLDRRYTAGAAVAVAVVKQLATDPKLNAPSRLTRDALTALPTRGGRNGPPTAADLFASGLVRATQRHAPLFESGRPRLETVRQGTAGDCFCLAPMGGLVHRDAVAIGRMFQPWPGGGHRVTFGDGRAATIPPLTDAELVLTGWNGGDGLWVNVYEKAVADVLSRDRAGKPRLDLALDATAGGGSTAAVMELLTGHRTRVVPCRPPAGAKGRHLTADGLRELLRDAGPRLVCASTPDATTTPDLTPNHAFAVLGYDRTADAVTLWDPHGHNFTPSVRAGPPRPEGRLPDPPRSLRRPGGRVRDAVRRGDGRDDGSEVTGPPGTGTAASAGPIDYW